MLICLNIYSDFGQVLKYISELSQIDGGRLVGLANGGLFIFVERFWSTDSQNNIKKSVIRGWYSDYM